MLSSSAMTPRTTIAPLLAIFAVACATGSDVTPRGGDGGDRRDASSGALDGGGATGDGGSIGDSSTAAGDAGGRGDGAPSPIDGGAPPIDGGVAPIDSGPTAIDGGPTAIDSGGCVDGTTMPCATACGTTGITRCVGGSFRGCGPPAESCNGTDDDCDGTADEGFRAVAIRASYVTDLAPRHPPCDGTTQSIGPHCNAAIHRYCALRGCTASGFGPDEIAGDSLDLTCVVADVRTTTYTELGTHHAGCTSAVEWGMACNAAIHRYCASLGFVSGFGPVEHMADVAAVSCVRAATVVITSYSTLATYQASCDGVTERIGAACNAAIHRFCIASGHVSGYGPVENDADLAYVTCVDA
jgi:hypothetical protein